MLQKTVLLLIGLFNIYIAAAQYGKIQGTIYSPDGKPLPAINITLEGTSINTQTQDDGTFLFEKVPPGNYVIVATGVGYIAKSQKAYVPENNVTSLSLELDIATSVLKEVVVTTPRPNSANILTRIDIPAREIPQNIQNVSRTLMNDQQLFQLDEAFKNIAGITLNNNYGGATTRGYDISVSGITTNGIKGSMTPEGQIPLLANIESIQVIHGPNAIMFGPGGLGGNINLVTKQPKKYSSLNASLGAGRFGLFRGQADVSGSIAKKQNLYFIAGMGFQNGGMFTEDFERRNIQVYGSLKWEMAQKTTWQINVTYQNDKATNNYQPTVPIYNSLNRDSIFLVPYNVNLGKDSRYNGNNLQLQSIMEHHFSDDWKLGFIYAYNESRAERRQFSVFGNVDPVTSLVERSYTWQQINSPQNSFNVYAVGKANTFGIKHRFSMGGDANLSINDYPNGMLQYSANSINVFNPVDDPKYDTTGMRLYTNSAWEKFTYNVLGAYVMDQIEFLPGLRALFGLRYNNYFRRYRAVRPDGSVIYDERPARTENFSPRFGLTYQPIDDISIYLDYNEGFSPHYSNNVEYGGPFDPETSKQYELGIKGDLLNGTLSPFISIYQSSKKNVLQVVPKEGVPYWLEAIGEVLSRGIETGITGYILPNLFINFNYNYNKTKVTESNNADEIGQEFANSPNQSSNAFIKYTFSNGTMKGLFLGAGYQYVSSRYFSNKNKSVDVPEMPEYTLFDALVGYRFKNYSLQVNGNNLFDKRYAASGGYSSYIPGMPRNIMVTFSYTL